MALRLDSARLEAAYKGGSSATELARLHKVSVWAIITRLRAAGVQIRKNQNERRINLPAEQEEPFLEYVDGLLLGDGAIDKKGLLRLDQYQQRGGWLDQAAKELGNIGVATRIIPLAARNRQMPGESRIIKGTPGQLLYTPAYVEMQQQRQRWYPAGKKVVPSDVRLTPKSIALWFAGDGTYDFRGRLIFCTDAFSETTVKALADRIHREHGIYAVARRVSGRASFHVAIERMNEAFKLRDLIAPLLPDCLQYKLEHVRRSSNGTLSEEQVRAIRQGIGSQRELALKFGTSKHTISSVRREKSYKHVL